MTKLSKNPTIKEIYEPAMKITSRKEADEYFKNILNLSLEHKDNLNKTIEEIDKDLRSNLAYYAGYSDNKTRERVEKLFNCEHPIFGKISELGPPTNQEAFILGSVYGGQITLKELRKKENG